MKELTPASFKGRRRNKLYEDEEEDIDSLLSSVEKRVEDEGGDDEESDEEGERRRGRGEKEVKRERRSGRLGGNEESFGAARRKKLERAEDEAEEMFGDDSKEDVDEEEDVEGDEDGAGEGVDVKKGKSGRVPKGTAITVQETVRLDNVSLKGRRRRVIRDEEEDIDAVLASVAKKEDVESVDDSKKEKGEEKMQNMRVPRGERITAQEQQRMETLSLKDRRRRRTEDEVR